MRAAIVLFMFFFGGCLWAQTPISWVEALREAQDYHPDLAIARESLLQAKKDLVTSRSQTLPSLNLSATAAESKIEGIQTESSSVGLSATQTLWDGGKKGTAVRVAKSGISSAQAIVLESSASTRYNLRLAYLDLWYNQATEEILRSIEALREKNLKLIELRYKAGTEHRGAYKQALAKLSQAQFELRASSRNSQQVSRSLSQAIGSPTQVEYRLTDGPLLILATDTQHDFEALAKNHPSYLKKQAQATASKASIAAAKAEFGPTLTLGASAAMRDTDGFSPEEENFGATLSLSWPLWDFGERSSKLQKARSSHRASIAAVLSQKNSLITALGNSWNSYKNACENLEIQKSFLEAAAERNRIAAGQYDVGLISYDNWTLIEDSYVAAQKSELASRLEALKAEAAWLYAKGTPLYENQ